MRSATPIDLRSGDDVSAIDMTMTPLPTRRVRGTVTNLPVAADSGGGPGVVGYVRAEPLNPSVFDRTTSPTNLGSFDKTTGAFEIRGLLPGKYEVMVNATLFRNGAVTVRGRAAIEVTSSDLENITVALSPGFDLPLHATIEGRAANGQDPDLSKLRVVLSPDFSGPASQQAPGILTFRGIPASSYQMRVQGLPDNGYVKSIRLGDTNVLSDGLRVDRTPDNPVEIVVGLNAGAVAGRVAGGIAQSPAGIRVALVPNAPNRQRADLYRNTSTDASGGFRFAGLTPGDYKLFAWEDVEDGAWQDPDFIKKYEDRGKPLRIEEGITENTQVTVIP
jgi:hypothetical protein